jgi:GTP-binding protein
MFIDKARIFITAGRGGAGCISFRREKYVPFGGPDGGNGGSGGDVFLVADERLTTLLDVSYRPHYEAVEGSNGSSSNKTGKSAPALRIHVPAGTVVYKEGVPIADLVKPGDEILVAAGGRGGRGNASFKTGKHTAPRIAEKGEPGQTVTLDLELMLIADVGLAGMPNAGKSTFLSRITAARPKIADYPFTTLAPNLGVARYHDRQFVVADIPGLIEGAHTGKGIGDEFLRHIQRTRVLIHLIDVQGFGELSAVDAYRVINRELKSYAENLLHKPMLIAINKMDLTDAAKLLAQFKRRCRKAQVFPISAVTGEGIPALLKAVVGILALPAPQQPVIAEPVKTYGYEPAFSVVREAGVYVVTGKKIETLAAMTEFQEEEALRRFQNIIKKMGLEKALLDAGIQPGNPVRIGEIEFTFKK